MIDYVVNVLRLKTVVRLPSVSVNIRALLNMPLNVRLQGFPSYVRYNVGSNFAVLKQAHNRNLASPASAQMPTLAKVYIASKTADESFVNLNIATKLVKGSGLHCLSDAVKQEPCGLLGDAKRAVKLIGANAILRVDDQPDSRQPLVQTDRAILHDGSDLDAEVLLAALANPDAASLNERVLCRLATRARDTVRPTDRNHTAKRSIRIGEVFDGLKQCFWECFVHGEGRLARISI